MAQENDAERRFTRARQIMARGRREFSEAYRLLRGLGQEVRHARVRGQINQMTWDCEKLSTSRSQYFSQSGQDAFVDQVVFKGKRGGVFVEIGGYDGITGSNSMHFELLRGWSGLMVEAVPSLQAQAAAFRRCPCLPVAVATEAGEADLMVVEEGMLQMSGLTATYDPEVRKKVEAAPRHRALHATVPTRPLADILDGHGLTRVDYLSLDICGGELAVLRSFPFERFDIHVMGVDTTAGGAAVTSLMQEKGYNRVEAFGTDDIFLRENV